MLLHGVAQSQAVTSGLAWANHGAGAPGTTASNSMSSPFLRTGPALTHFGDDSATSKLLSIANQVLRAFQPPTLLSSGLE
jgi:hypothetical protein